MAKDADAIQFAFSVVRPIPNVLPRDIGTPWRDPRLLSRLSGISELASPFRE